MKAHNPFLVVVLLLLVPVALIAQVVVRDQAPLKNWQAPLYWQPTQAESQAIAAVPDTARNANSKDDATLTPAPLVFVGMTPCRLVDTRVGRAFTGSFGPHSLKGSASRTFAIRTSAACTIPPTAQAYSLNVTMDPRGHFGVIKIYPTGQALPLAETLISTQGLIVDNAAIVPAGRGGSLDAYASEPTDLIIDINGYYAPTSAISLAQGTASEPALSVSGDAGTGMLASQPGALNLAAGGAEAVTFNSIGDMNVAGRLHANGPISSGNSISINGLTNSITVDSATPPVSGKPNEIYIGGDSGGPVGPTNLFSNIRVGIGTRDLTGDSKVKIFSSGVFPDAPAIEVTTLTPRGGARLQLAVAPCSGCYSTVAAAGDVIVGAKSGASEDLILAATNGHQGAIRFTTGFAQGCGVPGAESQKMVLTNAGNLGIGSNFTTRSCGGPTQVPVTAKLDVDGNARIRNLPPGNTLNNLVVADGNGGLFTRNFNTKIQSGIVPVGQSPTNLKRVTVVFPVAFNSTPVITANTLQGTDFPFNIDDTFAVSVQSVTTTGAVIQVLRIRPTGAGWAQHLQLGWIAVSP